MAISDRFNENNLLSCGRILAMPVRKAILGGVILLILVTAIICAFIFLKEPMISRRPITYSTFVPTFSLNTSIDPCSNFYEFTCSLWSTNQSSPDEMNSNTFSVLNKYIREKRRKLFENSGPHISFPNAVNDAFKFYNICVNFERNNLADTDYLLEYFKEMGGWPILNIGLWDDKNFDWIQASSYLLKTSDVETILGVHVTVDDTNSSASVLYIKPPNFKDAEFTLNEYFNLERLYFILKTLNPSLDDNEIARGIQLIRDTEVKWRQLFSISAEPDQVRISFRDLHEKFPQFDWLKYVQLIMNDTLNELGAVITDEDIILVENFVYFEKAVNSLLMMKFSKREIANLFGWYVVQDIFILIPSVLENYANINGYDFESTLEVAKDKCFEKTIELYECSIDYLYVQNVSHLGVADSAVLVRYIRNAYQHALVTSDWLDDNTKMAAVSKLNSLKTVLGFKDYHKNKTLFDILYKDLPQVSENILVTYFKLKYYFMSQTIFYYKFGYGSDWILPRPITDVSAYYIPQKNVFAVPISLYFSPFYYQHGPWYLNFGALGTIIGHEFTHAFDRQGCQRGELGDLKNWWTNSTLKMYKKRSHCFANQYASFYNSSLTKNQTFVTLDENIADNEGLRIAYSAYKLWVNDNGLEGVHPLFKQYSPDQMFFIAYGTMWCSKPKNVKKSDVHSLPKIRVTGVVSNSEFFAQAFKCPSGSPMNPEKKCHLW